MNPNPDKNSASDDNASLSGVRASISPSAPPKGSEGVLPLPTHESPDADMQPQKPSRAGQIGEGSYEGTDGYAKRIKSYLRTHDADKAAAAAAPLSKSEARDMLAAEFEAASRSKAPGQ